MSTRFEPDELRELEQRLTERLEAIAPRPGLAAGEQARGAIAGTAQHHGLVLWLRTHTPEHGWSRLIAVSATAVVAFAIGIGIGHSVLTTATHSPSSQPSASAPAHSSSATPSSSSEPRADIYQTWRRTDLPQGTAQAHGDPHDVVEFQDSLVVVGGADTGQCVGAGCVTETSAAVWRRVNGEWQRLSQQQSFDAGSMRIAAASANHLLVLGDTTKATECAFRFCAELWLSTDGQTFNAYRAPAQFTAIVAVESGFAEFLATATVASGTGTEIWRSLDGRTWERVASGGVLASAAVSKLRRIGPMVIAVGATFTLSAAGSPTLFISVGGQEWSQPNDSWGGSVADVDGSGNRLVAVGQRPSGGSAWTSDDGGLTWKQFPAATDATLDRHPLGTVRAVPGGFVALGDWYSSSAYIWTSVDGRRWDEVPAQPSIGLNDFLGPMTLTASGDLVVLGVHNAAGVQTAAVWTSSNQVAATPTPSLPTSTEFSSWTRLGIPDPTPHTFGGEWPYAAVEFRGQVIAVGGIYGRCCTGTFSTDTRAVVWHTIDMKTWRLEPDRPDFALGRMTGIAANARVLMSVGSVEYESKSSPGEISPVGAVWTSLDGVSWTRTTGSAIFSGIAWFRDRFYAVAQPQAGNERFVAGIWSSPDGRTWSLVERTDGDGLMAIRTTPLGLVAVGDHNTSSSGPAIWFSRDGVHWARSTVPGGPQEFVTDVAGSASTLMAIGLGDTGGPAVWVSHDGNSWTQTVDDFMLDGPTGPQLARIIWAGDEFLALGVSDIGGTSIGFRAMTSRDGTQWSLVSPASALESSTGQITEAIRLSTDDLLVLAAGDGGGGHHGVPLGWLVTR